MSIRKSFTTYALFLALALAGGLHTTVRAQAVDSSLSFFITGRSLLAGGNLGGLSGADAHCQQLADSVGAGGKVWRAYLSTQNPVVNARDRIGTGPWFNANKVMIAADLTVLHDTTNTGTINGTTGLTHRGATVASNTHDIMTGSKFTGLAPLPGADSTCADWTSASAGGTIVGHHNRSGVQSNICRSCWNMSHRTNGCTQANVQQGGGLGYFYCFAATGVVGVGGVGADRLPERVGAASAYAPYILTPGGGAAVVYRFELARDGRVEVSVHDPDGAKRATLLRERRGAGRHEVRWDGTDSQGAALPAGLYLIVLKRDGQIPAR